MASVGDVLNASGNPGLKSVTLSVSTKTDEVDDAGDRKKISKDFTTKLPANLTAAVEVLGEKAVFRYFVNALVVDLQADERGKLAPAAKGERKKAPYLEQLGL